MPDPEHDSADGSGPSRSSRRRALRVGLLALAAMAVLPSFPARAAESPRLGIKPAYEANFLHLALLPGGRTTNTAVVSNYSDQPSRIRIYAVDGGTTPQGQFALGSEGDSRRTVGSWLVPSVSELTLSPRSSSNIEFAVAVPPGTTPRDYVGGLVLEGEPRPGPAEAVGNATAVQFTIVERLGMRVYLRVEGDARAHLVAGPLTSDRVSGGAMEFVLALRNDGNTQLAPSGVVTVNGFGMSGESITLSRPELLLPGATTTVRGRWNGMPLYALGHAKAVVSYGNGQTAEAFIGIRLIPVVLIVVVALLAAGLSYFAYRFLRFVQRARVALQALNK